MLAYQLLTGRFPFWEDVRNETLSDVWKVGGGREGGQPRKHAGTERGRSKRRRRPSSSSLVRRLHAASRSTHAHSFGPRTTKPGPAPNPRSPGRAVPGD
jgi:hypothetical protein